MKFLSKISEEIKEYFEIRANLIKLDVQEDVAAYISRFAPFFIGMLLAASAALFISLGLSRLISELSGVEYLGYFVLGAAYLFSFGLLYAFRNNKKLLDFFFKAALRVILPPEEEEEEKENEADNLNRE